MELLIMVDALRRSSAARITAAIPYYGYARQDRKVRPRVPITAKLVADLISTPGTDRVLCIDLHAGQIQGFFNIPVDNVYATPVLLQEIRNRFPGPQTIISPDAGGVERARAYAKRLDAELAIIDKRREAANVSEVMNIVGDVKGRNCVIVDDMVDTAGTLTESPLEELVVTDTIPLRPEAKDCEKLKVVSVAPLLGEAIRRINNEESVSSLFV
jgi:ribose-phosphate pyrophosphokinase